MSNHIRRSLSLQLFFGVLISLLAAVAVFGLFLSTGGLLLNHTVYGSSFSMRMADRQFDALQSYVEEEEISAENLQRLNVWCSRQKKIYLTIYLDDDILYESPISGKKKSLTNPSLFDPESENPDYEYQLELADGLTVRTFLYYYAGDAYHLGSIAVASLSAFITFSVCFVVLIRWKLSYIAQLKDELEILAGGNLNYQITVRGADELSELASGVEQMRRFILAHQAAEDQMRSANSELVTAMSHDLRTPLTSLLAYLELMDRGKYENEEQLHHFIHRSLEKTLRIKSMADKLFEYYLFCASEWENPDLESVDADETFQQFWGEFVFSLENSGFTVEQDFRELNGTLLINPELIHRAVDNLYSNIQKYADPSSPVRISFERIEDRVALTLINGISAQRTDCESSGIGLNTCQRILHSHGGSFLTQETDHLFQIDLTLPLQKKF